MLGLFDTQYTKVYDNTGTAIAGNIGTSVTPGTSNANGSYTQIASSANIAANCHFVVFRVAGGSTPTAAKLHMLTLGIDPAGGSSYTDIITDLIVSSSSSMASALGGRVFAFPLFIPSGASVAVKVRGSAGTAGTVRVAAKFYAASRPDVTQCALYAETIGATTASTQGVSVAPGNASYGSWTSIGTTAQPLWWFQLGVHLNNTASSGHNSNWDLAYGDGTNYVEIITCHETVTNTAEATTSGMAYPCLCPVPAGSTLYVRGIASGAPDSGYEAVVTGLGGTSG